jgi:hypothetical protein
MFTSLTNGDELLTDPTRISEHIVNHYTYLFNNNNNTIDNGMMEEVIPSLITDRINNILTILPTMEEITQAVFSLNKESAPGPGGFGALFYQTFLENY